MTCASSALLPARLCACRRRRVTTALHGAAEHTPQRRHASESERAHSKRGRGRVVPFFARGGKKRSARPPAVAACRAVLPLRRAAGRHAGRTARGGAAARVRARPRGSAQRQSEAHSSVSAHALRRATRAPLCAAPRCGRASGRVRGAACAAARLRGAAWRACAARLRLRGASP
jgi:hypothetical protein